jgi:hypothetical protein
MIGGFEERRSFQNVHGQEIGWMPDREFELGDEVFLAVSLLSSLALNLNPSLMI